MTRTIVADGEPADHPPTGEEGQSGEPLYGLIELMFFAYRDFVADADRMLARDGFGRAHHRVLYFTSRRPGLSVAELLDILQIKKQSLNRVLNDLLDRDYVTNELGRADRRQRLLSATSRGDVLVASIARLQSRRFEQAFALLGDDARPAAAAFLQAMRSQQNESLPGALTTPYAVEPIDG